MLRGHNSCWKEKKNAQITKWHPESKKKTQKDTAAAEKQKMLRQNHRCREAKVHSLDGTTTVGEQKKKHSERK